MAHSHHVPSYGEADFGRTVTNRRTMNFERIQATIFAHQLFGQCATTIPIEDDAMNLFPYCTDSLAKGSGHFL